MEGVDLRVLFTYRLLVQAGFLDDDIAGEDIPRSTRILVHDDLCIGCYACRDECPASAIRLWDGQAHVMNPVACISCAETPCVPVCPTEALEDQGLETFRIP